MLYEAPKRKFWGVVEHRNTIHPPIKLLKGGLFMYTVYILKSELDPSKHYVGFTQNLNQRLQEHNGSPQGYAKRYSPWLLETFVVFQNKERAIKFEQYLKRGSGHAFLLKYLI